MTNRLRLIRIASAAVEWTQIVGIDSDCRDGIRQVHSAHYSGMTDRGTGADGAGCRVLMPLLQTNMALFFLHDSIKGWAFWVPLRLHVRRVHLATAEAQVVHIYPEDMPRRCYCCYTLINIMTHCRPSYKREKWCSNKQIITKWWNRVSTALDLLLRCYCILLHHYYIIITPLLRCP